MLSRNYRNRNKDDFTRKDTLKRKGGESHRWQRGGVSPLLLKPFKKKRRREGNAKVPRTFKRAAVGKEGSLSLDRRGWLQNICWYGGSAGHSGERGPRAASGKDRNISAGQEKGKGFSSTEGVKRRGGILKTHHGKEASNFPWEGHPIAPLKRK